MSQTMKLLSNLFLIFSSYSFLKSSILALMLCGDDDKVGTKIELFNVIHYMKLDEYFHEVQTFGKME